MSKETEESGGKSSLLSDRTDITRLLLAKESLERGKATPLGQALGRGLLVGGHRGVRAAGDITGFGEGVGGAEDGGFVTAEVAGDGTLGGAEVSSGEETELGGLS